MQDFRTIPGLAARIFGGLDLRRPRGIFPAAGGAAQGAVKCPRCESPNTKFCYYNNYNLSQPRYFCKACRRYWTRGGLLRNVPIGGGRRKSKRSSSSSVAASDAGAGKLRRTSSASRSSSDSSNLTAAAADPSTSSSYQDSTLLPRPISDPNPDSVPTFDPSPPSAAGDDLSQAPELFQETAGIFSAGAALGFSYPDPVSVSLPGGPEAGQVKAQGLSAGFEDLQLFNLRSSGAAGGSSTAAFPGINWGGPVGPSFFDLDGGGDAGAYWSQSGWADADPSLRLP